MAPGIVGIGPTWLGRRQMGLKNPLGTKNHIYEQMYSNILPYGSWDHTFNNMYASVHGGVFCLEFSPEGSLLVAACEKRSVLMFDPLTHKRIHSVENAHLDCVNCIRFLDSRSFATCSDDFTVALWDARNLNQKVRSLKGHSNWVKNIEYSPQDGLLVTSGFDGSILTWEMNKYREDGIVYNKVFSTNGLMRTRLTPDATKMVICTTGGYLIIIHNLDLNAMSQDLDGFKPNMYRLMQLSQTILPVAADFTNLFRGQGKRNRVEFITDFPEGDDAEVVSSLQIHPDGHCAISRNVNNNEKSEWSCIHNIEERLSSDESDFADDDDEGCGDYGDDDDDDDDDGGDDDDDDDDDDDLDGCKMTGWPGTSTSISTTPSYIIQHAVVESESRVRDAGTDVEHRDLSVSPSDVWEALVAIQEARIRREFDRGTAEMSAGQMFRRQSAETGMRARPANFDSRIFVTRILPSANGDGEENHRRLENSGPAFRRNAASVNATEMMERHAGRGHVRPSSIPRNARSKSRKKLPARQRYASLYRRSLVGLYDRTSVLRKPIYNHGLVEFKLKKLKKLFKLNTNYEMNETRRLQNEMDAELECSTKSTSKSMAQRQAFDQGRGSKAREGHDSTLSSTSNPFESEKKNGVRRRSEESAGSGLCLRRSVNAFDPAREDGDRSDVNSNGSKGPSRSPSIRGVDRSRERENVVGTTERGGERIERENGTEDGGGTSRETSVETSSKPGVSRPSAEPTSDSRSPGEKTILMSVFRAGNEDGIRRTSMRKHNVAACVRHSSESFVESVRQIPPLTIPDFFRRVTVSSPTQTGSSAVGGGGGSGRHRPESGKMKCCNDSSKSKSHEKTNVGRRSNERNRSNKGNIYCSSQRYPAVPVNKKIHQNAKRLTHYVEEPNLGRGFIKELCVSPDGRIICSPFGNGIRLLSFSPTVQDVFHCYPVSPPIPLHELTLNVAHTDIVVSTKFSPFHNLLVSGCLSGKIVYYQPFL